jgi:hypothetical protein
MKTNWNELFKIRIANSDDSFQKHEVIKLLLVMKLLNKNKKDKNFIRIYTEYQIDDETICDVYFENNRTKEALAYEIQKSLTTLWLEDRKNKYKDWEVYGMNSSDWIPVPLKESPNNLDELNEWLNQYIF